MATKKKAPAVDPNQPLIDAAKAGDATEVLRILDAGRDVDLALSPNLAMTALDFAIGYEHPELAEALLGRGATPTPMTQRCVRASTPETLFARIGVNPDPTAMAHLSFFETTAAGRQQLVRRSLKHGLKLSQASLYWMIIGSDRTDADEVTWAIDLHAKVKIDVNAAPKEQSESSLMELAISNLPLTIMARFVEMGGVIAPGRKVADDVEDSAAKKKWLAAHRPRGTAKKGLALFGNLTDDELTDDVIIEALLGATDVFPDREAWAALAWEDNAADQRAHLLERAGDGLRYELFINSEGGWNAAVASSKVLYTRLYTELTKRYGKTKKGKKHTEWEGGVRLELTECRENPYGPFGDHWTGIAVQLDAM